MASQLRRHPIEVRRQRVLFDRRELLQLLQQEPGRIGRQNSQALKSSGGVTVQVVQGRRIEPALLEQRLALRQAPLGKAQMECGLVTRWRHPQPGILRCQLEGIERGTGQGVGRGTDQRGHRQKEGKDDCDQGIVGRPPAGQR
jgi:hypothetical protein